MNVLMITMMYPIPRSALSGLFIREQAEALRRAGVDVKVLSLSYDVPWPFNQLNRYRSVKFPGEVELPEWVYDRPMRCFPRGIGRVLASHWMTPRLLEEMKSRWSDFQPDLIHAHGFIPCGVYAEKMARVLNCPVVLTSHGGDTRVMIHRRQARNLILNQCRHFSTIVCVGEVIRQALREHGAGSENLVVLSNGIDLSKIHTGTNLLRERYAGKRIITGLGNLYPTKGFDLLIEAFSILRGEFDDLQGLIVGGGTERTALESLIQRHALEGRVELVGAKPPEEAMGYLAACDLFCLPSWSEGFGIVYLEAMAHGKPVIAVEGQGCAELIERHQTGLLVPPRNAEAVAGAIRHLLNHREEARTMGQRGHDLVHQHYSWDHNARQIIEIYLDAIQAYSPRTSQSS
jgi:teichuronic acid biosynthesis glycosyltransferase TuaC